MNSSRSGLNRAPRPRTPTDDTPDSPVDPVEEELVDEMAEQSFPGSDPPATWAGPDDPSSTPS